MTKLQKILSAMLVIAMLISVGAVMAQDDDTTAPDDTTFCMPMNGVRGDSPVHATLEALGLTQDDIRAYMLAGGTIEELLAENGVDIELLREAHHAAQEATLLTCVDEAEANGLISSEQANQVREAIADGTLPELIQSGEFDELFPRFGANGHGQRGNFGESNGFGDGEGRSARRGGYGFGGNGQ